ncbi:MAG: exosortase T [Gammaproteobacteria bacterium]|nr:exosortase T [Gammaproteobacteria bacterium]
MTSWVLLAGAALLALEPTLWLVGTWHREGYDGIGVVAFALVAGLFTWSMASPVRGDTTANPRTYLLLAATAVIRLAAQVLDVNAIGALLLAVDVYALAYLARLPHRSRSLSPFWLAVLFCFSLPIEPMLQRVVGYGLQQISAFLACGMLTPFFDSLTCSGVRLQVNGADVLVDLPCSGAELVSITAFIFAVINTLNKPTAAGAAIGSAACLIFALLGNGLRITLLAAGIANAETLPFHVMDKLPHTMIGLSMIGLTSLALVLLTRAFPAAPVRAVSDGPTLAGGIIPTEGCRPHRSWIRLTFAGVFLSFALLVGAVQPQPVDASPHLSSPDIPLVAAGFLAETRPLTNQEQDYFTRYGGAAKRAGYGPFGLLLVSTSSPLRHLHDPTICLTGMGYAVRLLGTDHATKSTVYVAEKTPVGAPAERYTVRVSYRSDEGTLASSIAEVVWLWLQTPATRWTMVQRVVPDHPAINSESALLWENAMRRAFNLS